MDTRRQHQGMHAPLQSQQFPPLLQQGGGQPPRLPLPLLHPNTGFNPRSSSYSGPVAGQKRSSRPSDNGAYTKLFVASLPRNISEEEVRDLFGGFGNVLEVIFLKDKKTGLPQGCCFIKYANVMDAERAIRALDNQRTLPGGPAPLQVKFADGERDHPGPFEHKLFVGSLNKQAGEQEIEEIFAPYGRVENVYLIRDEQKQSRGCAFVTFPEKEMAIAAISALNGIFRMAGCHQPIIVRFADPKRPRSGERDTHRMGGPGPNYSPRSHQGSTGPNYHSHYHQGAGGQRGSGGPAMEAHGPTFGWRQGGGAGSMGLLPQAGILPLGAPSSTSARKGHLENPSSAMGIRSGGLAAQGAPAISSQSPVSGMSPQLSHQQGLKESPLHKPGQGFGQLLSSHQQHSLSSTSQHNPGQSLQGFSMPQSTDTRSQQHVPAGQYSSPQPGVQMYGQTQVALNQVQQQSIQQPIITMSSQAVQFQLSRQQDSQSNQQAQNSQPLQQIPQLQPIPSQVQSQGVAKETPQQVYIQPLQMMNQSSLQPVSWQPSWSIPSQQQAIPPQQQTIPSQQQANPSLHQTNALPSQQQVNPLQQQSASLQQHSQQQAVSLVTTPALTPVPAKTSPTVASCDWTEHISPEGHKYYYNSTTGESRWEKPEEFAAFEKQQQSALPLQQQQQLLQQQQQQPQQVLQNQVQAPAQQLQPQHLNQQYQQQQLLNHQPQQQVQPAPSQQVQPYQQQPQSQMQTLQTQLQQPQLQQFPLLQQVPQLQQLQQQLLQSQPQLQQVQRESQFTSSGLQFSQLPSGNGYQVIQGYTHVQPASQPANGIANGPHLQQFAPNQQQVQANGMPDTSRGAQWMPSMQQGLPNQDYSWKPKPAGP